MNTYAARRAVRRTTGHYRKPGTDRSYCGLDLDHAPTPADRFRAICKTCTKAEARDRAEAQAVADDHREGATEQALAQTLTPKMREVLPAVVAAGDFPDNGLAHLPEGITFPSLQALIRRGLAEKYDTGERFIGFEGRRYKVERFRATDLGRAVAAVLTAEQAAAVDAEANEGTWRGAWIGEQADDDALFPVERPADQGALFDQRATASAPTIREQRRAALDRIKARADADRAAYRAATDEQIAAECAAHGVPAPRTVAARIAARAEQAPERRVVEGVIVTHNGRTKGTAPKHSADPDALAALAALGDLRKAEVSDHTDISAQPGDLDHTPDAWGFLVEPRGRGRVALYWVERGRYVRPDGEPWAVELEIGADKLRKAGWKIEPHARRCVFAWRPTE